MDPFRPHVCPICGKCFARKNNLIRHNERHRNTSQHHCRLCGKVFGRSDFLLKHRRNVHGQTGGGIKRGSEEPGPASKRIRLSDDPKEFYTLRKISEWKNDKFRTKKSTYLVNFKDINVEGLPEILKTLKRLFTSLFEEVTQFVEPNDLIKLTVQCPELDFPISLPVIRREDLNVELFLSEIERVLQSYEEFVLDSSLEIELLHIENPEGAARKRCKYVNLEKFLKEKQCFIRIQNKDELCCARAIVTAKAKLDGHPQWKSIVNGKFEQKSLAKELHEKAGVPLGCCGIEEIKKFQTVLKEYQINVISREHFNAIIYSGPEAEKRLYLYHHDDHYDVITSMPAFVNKSYYCTKCQKGYDHRQKHKCGNVCFACRKIHPPTAESRILCQNCNRYFQGQACFDLHQKATKKGNSTCKTYYTCKSCGKTINKSLTKNSKKHVCGETFCKTCKDYYPEGHLCYMMPVISETSEKEESVEDQCGESFFAMEAEQGEEREEENQKKLKTYIFFDFEAIQDDLIECEKGYELDPEKGRCKNCQKSKCGSMEHRPNLCVAHKVCESCLDEEITPDSFCDYCEENQVIFKGPNTTDDFCEWLFSENNEGAIVLAHNFKGYDSYPILQYLYKNGIKPAVITNGAKIMSLFVPDCKIKMIDSINFLPMALSKLPGMFKIEELCKGYFPHLYNRKENQTKVLDGLPDINFYNPDGMKPGDRQKFLKWYEEHQHDRFDFRIQLENYCRSDVDILRRCCLKFRELFMEVTSSDDGEDEIDPFEHCCTIASACNLVFRTRFLQPDTIGIIKSHGYRPEHKQSIKALQWLKFLSHKMEIPIQHARNGTEKRIGKYLVDGYYEKEDGMKVVLEFHGCFWHGCPQCYSKNTINPVSDMSMGDLYERTLEKQRYIESQRYTYVCKWEHDFDQEMKNNPDLSEFVSDLDFVLPLEPRDAFYGGRTEAFTLSKEASSEEDIDYYDVTSLYPWVNKTGKVPLGHPRIITENFEDITNYEGLIKCKVIPPKSLYIPVLPAKIIGKLLFPLCNTCARTQQQMPCRHSDEERAFTGTWVTDELKKAVEKGYRISRVNEVWHFDNVEQYDPIAKKGGVFTTYVNTFLKIKQEASGWPKWCKTEEDRQTYIRDYYEKEGILLDYDKIEENPGLRALAKLMLNSFWGKFGQRDNLPQVSYISDPSDYFDLLTSDEQEVLDINFVSDETVEMRWRNTDEFIETSGKTNVVIAAYTTTQARLKLYSYLEKLGPRSLYVDTDSCIFSSKKGEWKPPLDDYLGDLTDEVSGNRIVSFVTGGPKNYAYKLQKPDKDGNRTHCKVRGITLNYKNVKDINFNSIHEMIYNFVVPQIEETIEDSNSDKKKGQKGVIVVKDNFKICRDARTRTLLTTQQNKEYRVVFDKRVIRNDFRTEPYGY